MNIKTAAERWGLTVRRVQDLCKSGNIQGATRFGRAWMIPEETQRPADGRTKTARTVKKQIHGRFLLPVPRENPLLTLTDLYHTPGTADTVTAQYADYPETEKIFAAQFAFRRGNIDDVYALCHHFLREHVGFYSTVSAGALLAFCAVWKGDIHLWKQARQHIYDAPCRNDDDRHVVDFWLGVVDSAIYDTATFPDWFRRGEFTCLPADSYGTARLYYVKYMFINAQELAVGKRSFPDVEGLGLMRTLPYFLEPMLSQAHMERTLLPEIYLHLMAATVYHNLGDEERAITHIDQALTLCLPDRLYGVLVEYRSGLDNLLDERLGLLDPAALARVRTLHRQMYAGWIKLHNQLLERNVSATLTIREREVAKLAAFGLGNNEIARRLHLEVNSVKQYIFSAMNKVGADKRTELGQYV